MANKYQKLSIEARELRKKQKMCLNKHAYETSEEANQKGQTIYHCPHCGKWHRSARVAKLVQLIRAKKRKDPPALLKWIRQQNRKRR